MKKFEKSIAITMIISLCMLLAAPVDAKSKVRLNLTKATLSVGGTVNLQLLNNKKKVKWSSSNKKVATVTKKGKVKAKKKGTAKIVAKVGKKKYICKITVGKASKVSKSVKKTAEPTPTPEFGFGIAAFEKEIDLFVTSTEIQCFFKNIYSRNLANSVVWHVSDESIVKLLDTNDVFKKKIIPQKIGECEIMATINGVTESCHIKIIDKRSYPLL